MQRQVTEFEVGVKCGHGVARWWHCVRACVRPPPTPSGRHSTAVLQCSGARLWGGGGDGGDGSARERPCGTQWKAGPHACVAQQDQREFIF
eukprot:365083-Chlamydomonas_euryale.AAC.16